MYGVSFFYDSTLIHIEYIPFDRINVLQHEANQMIENIVRDNIPLRQQIKTYHQLLRDIVKMKRMGIKSDKHMLRTASFAILCLIKMRSLKNDNENGYLIMKHKPKSKVQVQAQVPSLVS